MVTLGSVTRPSQTCFPSRQKVTWYALAFGATGHEKTRAGANDAVGRRGVFGAWCFGVAGLAGGVRVVVVVGFAGAVVVVFGCVAAGTGCGWAGAAGFGWAGAAGLGCVGAAGVVVVVRCRGAGAGGGEVTVRAGLGVDGTERAGSATVVVVDANEGSPS
jgi:hypothetical protein